MMQGKPPFGLGSLISDSLKSLNLERQVKEHSCLLIWDEVVGEKVSGAAQPEFVKDGQLFVITKSPVWANELMFYKSDIISRLNKRIGGQVIKDIIFKAGRFASKSRKAAASQADIADPEAIKLTAEELAEVESTAQSAGEEASEGVKNLLSAAMQLEKWKKANGWKPCKKCGSLQNSAPGICPPCQIES